MIRCIIVAIVMVTSATLLACSSDDKPSETARLTPSSSTPSPAPSASAGTRSTSAPGPQPAPSLPPGVPVLALEDGRAATGLQAEGSCSDVQLRKPLALMTWTVAGTPGTEQRVAVSLAPDGLGRGAFNVSGPLSAGEDSLVWDDIEPGINHYWWVLTRHDEGYVPSESAIFIGETCEADVSQ